MAGLEQVTEFFNTGANGVNITSIGSQIIHGIMYALAIVMIVGAFYALYRMIDKRMGYKHTLVLRNINEASTSNFVQVSNVREETTNEGITYWVSLKPKLRIPAPPSEYIAITKRGRMFAEGVYRDGGISWVKPDLINLHMRTVKQVINGKEEEVQVPTLALDHFNGTQRWGYMESIKRAMRKRQDAFSKWAQLIPIGALLVIVVFGYMAFDEYKDTNIKTAEVHRKTAELFRDAMSVQNEISKRLDATNNNIQVVLGVQQEQQQELNNIQGTIYPDQEP